jgi:hypothetical protein
MTSTDIPVKHSCDENEPISQTVVTAVAEVTGCDPIELDPLYEYIDPDAMDALFHPRSNDDVDQSELHIEFSYTTYRVTVTKDYVHISNSEK